jgi:hypothetical protein
MHEVLDQIKHKQEGVMDTDNDKDAEVNEAMVWAKSLGWGILLAMVSVCLLGVLNL